jgi:hypothetical protein
MRLVPTRSRYRGARPAILMQTRRPQACRQAFADYFNVRTEKPRSFEQSSERLPSSVVSNTTSRPHSFCR